MGLKLTDKEARLLRNVTEKCVSANSFVKLTKNFGLVFIPINCRNSNSTSICLLHKGLTTGQSPVSTALNHPIKGKAGHVLQIGIREKTSEQREL